MKIITVDGKVWTKPQIKYQQNQESVSFTPNTASFDYPDFVGSKLGQNSTSSNKYTMTLTIHETVLVSFMESMKKFVINEDEALNDTTYGKLTHIVIEHSIFGAFKGLVVGDIIYNTSKQGDIPCRFVFQEHSPDEPKERKDLLETNDEAVNELDNEPYDTELDAADKGALLKLLDRLNGIYENIQNNEVISAIKNLERQLNEAVLNSQKIMNATKKIISLPNSIFNDFAQQFTYFKKQADAIKATPITSFNLAKFNVQAFSFNMGLTSKTTFVNEKAQQQASGIKTVPLDS